MATKTKSMMGREGGRKLASNAGRKAQKSGGEPKKVQSTSTTSRRTGSSKQRKG